MLQNIEKLKVWELLKANGFYTVNFNFQGLNKSRGAEVFFFTPSENAILKTEKVTYTIEPNFNGSWKLFFSGYPVKVVKSSQLLKIVKELVKTW